VRVPRQDKGGVAPASLGSPMLCRLCERDSSCGEPSGMPGVESAAQLDPPPLRGRAIGGPCCAAAFGMNEPATRDPAAVVVASLLGDLLVRSDDTFCRRDAGVAFSSCPVLGL